MVGFSREGARRVIDSTLREERRTFGSKRRVQRDALGTEADRFVRLKTYEGSGRYGWVAVQWTQSGWQENSDYGVGNTANGNYAQEISGTDQVILGSIVRVYWTEESYFIFIYDPQMYLGKLVSAGTISGREGNTPGSGTVTMQQYNPQSGEFEDGDDITVFNSFTAEIEGEAGETNEIYLHLHWHNGAFWIGAVDCEGVGGGSGGSNPPAL